jgi:hypothetical protein
MWYIDTLATNLDDFPYPNGYPTFPLQGSGGVRVKVAQEAPSRKIDRVKGDVDRVKFGLKPQLGDWFDGSTEVGTHTVSVI